MNIEISFDSVDRQVDVRVVYMCFQLLTQLEGCTISSRKVRIRGGVTKYLSDLLVLGGFSCEYIIASKASF